MTIPIMTKGTIGYFSVRFRDTGRAVGTCVFQMTSYMFFGITYTKNIRPKAFVQFALVGR